VKRILEFLFEAGALKRTPRSGWQFLGSGSESVADHSFRTALIAWVLARLDGEVDADRAMRMALFHDLPEARTSDLNYMNQKYVTADEERAAEDMTDGLPFGEEVRALLAEYREQTTPLAALVRDADNLDMILQLKEHLDHGNPNAKDWLSFARRRLTTETGKQLAERTVDGHSADWWFDRDSRWWVHREEE
jgi:putative hydrolase of HD superfamily